MTAGAQVLAKKGKSRRIVIEPIAHKALLALLAAIVLSVIPHVQHLPIWVWLLGSVTLFWSLQIHQGRWHFPSFAVKAGLVGVFTAVVVMSFWGGFSLDSAVSLFVAGLVLKPLELYNRRHAFVLVMLCYLLVGISFIYEQSLLFAFYQSLVLVWIVGAHIAIHSGPSQNLTQGLWLAFKLFCQALPLMVLLFVFVPRMGPLWHNPFSARQGVTGLANQMTPGDIAQLTKSNERVFRVSFEGEKPPQKQLYWRALILDQFDGRTWRSSLTDSQVRYAPQSLWQGTEGQSIDYQIIQEATQNKWLFSLAWPVPKTQNTGRTQDRLLVSRKDVLSPLRYRVTSYPDALIDADSLYDWERSLYLELPQQATATNARTLLWVKQLQQHYSNTQELIWAFMRFFREQPFYYSLKPSLLGSDNTIDRFLFDTRTGFCAHYSGALVFALRAAGIPSRMVAGYQGGEWNQEGQYLTVRQYDAHAWVEAWLPGKGWLMFDPTAMVAPERVEQSLEEAVGEEAFSEGRGLNITHIDLKWLQQLRLELEAINYRWTTWVLNYDRENQRKFFQRWLGSADWMTIGQVFVGLLLMLMVITALWVFKPWNRPKLTPKERCLKRFLLFAKRQGQQIEPFESPMMFANRLAALYPKQSKTIRAFAEKYSFLEYEYQGEITQGDLDELENIVRQLR